VPNPELKLKPGMTANVTVEVTRRTNVLRVANAATRFRPTDQMFSVLNQAVPAELQRSRGTNARGARPGTGAAPAASAQTAPPAPATARPARAVTSGATTIDALFAPIATAESRGAAWQYDASHQLKMMRLRLGATDGTFTEVLNDSDVPADAVLVTAMKTGLEPAANTASSPAASGNPLLGGQRGAPAGRGAGGR
jgi:HlyD family secretion protein